MRKSHLIACIFLLCCFLFTGKLKGQNTSDPSIVPSYALVKAKYGMDPVLVNGRYFEDIYRNDLGHPYLAEDIFYPGYCVIHGNKYEDILLKYNIYDQQLVILYRDVTNAQVVFIPPNEFVTEFSVNGQVFRKYTVPGYEAAYFEEVYSGEELSMLYSWTKKRFDSYHNKTFMAGKFSAAAKNLYVRKSGKLLPIKSGKDFLGLFDEANRQVVARFMKENAIRIRKSDPQHLQMLGSYCEGLVSKNSPR